MKKLNSINYVVFKDDKLSLEDIPISLGIIIEDWLKEYCNIPCDFENYSSVYSESERIKFRNYEKGIAIYLENRIIESVIFTHINIKVVHILKEIFSFSIKSWKFLLNQII